MGVTMMSSNSGFKLRGHVLRGHIVCKTPLRHPLVKDEWLPRREGQKADRTHYPPVGKQSGPLRAMRGSGSSSRHLAQTQAQ